MSVKQKEKFDDVIFQTWYNPQNSIGYAGALKLNKGLRKASIETTFKKTKEWLHNQLAFSLNKPIRRRFPTRSYMTSGIDDLWQADLMEMIPFSSVNSGYKYILTSIDVFSRFAQALPLKSKSAQDVAEAVKTLIKIKKPKHLQTDLGKEFYNSKVKSILENNKIIHYSVHSQFKAAHVERFNRTLRERLAKHFVAEGSKKWVNVLQKLIESYNNSKHRSIGRTPSSVSKENETEIWLTQNSLVKNAKAKYRIGDSVRISRINNSPFIKNFNNNWSDEIFQINGIDTRQTPIMYIIKDYDNDIIQGKFYEQELQVIPKPDVFRIQTILQTKGTGKNKQFFVKWHGYSKPSWISFQDLVK